MNAVVYDAGALIAADRNNRDFWADHKVRLQQGAIPTAPAAVVAQVSRSPQQVQLRRLLRGCDVAVLDEDAAHVTGHALGRAGTTDIVDSAVVTIALASSATVVTSDRHDIQHLADALNRRITIIDV